MKESIFKSVCSVMFILILAIGAAGAQETAQTNPEIDEKAMSSINNMANFLSKAQHYSVTVKIGYDAVQKSGQKIEFGSTRKMTVVRPNRARMEVTDRDGSKSGFIFDGKQISVYNTVPNVYATVAKPGTLDNAITYFTQDLDMVLPLADLFSSNLPQKMTNKIDSVSYVDESTINGVNCDHLAARNENVDFQLWIAKGQKPLPQRIVITYKNEIGQPQFWAQFSDWNLAPKVSDSYFAFTPPAGAQKIPFAPWKTASSLGEEKKLKEGKNDTGTLVKTNIMADYFLYAHPCCFRRSGKTRRRTRRGGAAEAFLKAVRRVAVLSVKVVRLTARAILRAATQGQVRLAKVVHLSVRVTQKAAIRRAARLNRGRMVNRMRAQNCLNVNRPQVTLSLKVNINPSLNRAQRIFRVTDQKTGNKHSRIDRIGRIRTGKTGRILKEE